MKPVLIFSPENLNQDGCIMMNGFFFTVLIGLTVFFTGGCLKKKTGPYTNLNLAETLRWSVGAEPPTLDWSKSTDTTSALVIRNIMDGLIRYDFSGNKPSIRPALARSYTASPDKTKWVFHLKSVQWSDGRPLTADHFVDGWERLLNAKTGSEYAYFLFPVKNARAYNEGRIKDFRRVGVKRGPKGELIVHLEKGLSHFPFLLTHPSTFPLRKDVVESKGRVWSNPENIVTLGAYRLIRWDHDKALILERNKTYYGAQPAVKKVIIYIVPEGKTMRDLFLAGRLDVASGLSSRDLTFLKKRKEYRNHHILSLYYYGFNVKNPVLKDVRVRKALIHAVSREEIVRLLNGGQKPLKSWIPEGIFGYNEQIGLSFDPEKALRLLDEAGYKNRSSFPRVKLSYNTTADHKMIAENVQSQLKRNLNIDIELINQEWKTYLQRLSSGNTEIFRLGWVADYPDPDNFMNLMTSFSDNNHTYWGLEEYDRLILKAMSLPNGSQRQTLYDKAQKILLEREAVVFPLFAGVSHLLISPRLKKYSLNAMSEVYFGDMELETDSETDSETDREMKGKNLKEDKP